MSNNFYTTKTAALKATTADIRNLNAQEIKLKGKNILDYIEESTPTVKHSQDTRETVTENDLWGQWIETTEDGTIIVHDDVVNPNGSSSAWNINITKVENNKAYVNETLYGNIQTDKIKNGQAMFRAGRKLTSFDSDLSNLTSGKYMFTFCNNLQSFVSDLTNLKDGDSMFAVCNSLPSFSISLPNLISGKNMFQECISLTSFNSNLSNLEDGNEMFVYCPGLISFNSDLPHLINGTAMFESCENLNTFSSNLDGTPINLSNLVKAHRMFAGCNLSSFCSNMPNLISSEWMFMACTNLDSFTANLHNLSFSFGMFEQCSNLSSFNSDLTNLKNSHRMFQNCTNLTSFTIDLPNLTVASDMFNGSNLTSFTSDLSSLTCGSGMFNKCKLNPSSIMYIAESIKNIIAEKELYINGSIPYIVFEDGKYSASNGFMSNGDYIFSYSAPNPIIATISSNAVGLLTLGIDVVNDPDTIDQQLQTFAKDATFNSWDELKQFFVDKGWTVAFQYGGTSTNITLSEDEQFRGTPVYARLIEVTPEGEEYTEKEKASAEYCTEDGTKYYNIDWGHDVTDYSQYEYFGSLLEACGYYGVIPKEYLEES